MVQIRIRDPGWKKKVGSGINIPDPKQDRGQGSAAVIPGETDAIFRCVGL